MVQSFVGRGVVGIDGPGYSVTHPAHEGAVVREEETRWGLVLTVRWEDGSEEGFMATSFRSYDLAPSNAGAIGVYMKAQS